MLPVAFVAGATRGCRIKPTVVLAAVLAISGGPAVSGELPDVRGVEADLVVPSLIDAEPGPGKRVRQQLPPWRGTEVYHGLYLPTNWAAGRKYPVLVEYPGNGPYRNKFGDTCSGRVDDCSLGYGLSGGRDFIWLTLPCVNARDRRNELYWWGDAEATVQYCKDVVKDACTRFGGDPQAVVLCGFSRGAIACNYIGLHDDEIAGLWRAFVANSHYDGVREWPYPMSDRDAARRRLARLGDRPTLIVQEGSVENIRDYLADAGVQAPFTFATTGFRNHTDQWVLRDVPARRLAREWLNAALDGRIGPQGNPQDGR